METFRTIFSRYNKFNLAKFGQVGSTLIELLISIMIVALVVTSVAVATTYSIKNSGEAKYRELATIYGQDVIELFRAEKNRLGFYGLKNAVPAGDYCFDELPDNLEGTLNTGACDSVEIGPNAGVSSLYDRDVVVIYPDANTIRLEVEVSWTSRAESKTSDGVSSVTLVQEFKEVNRD